MKRRIVLAVAIATTWAGYGSWAGSVTLTTDGRPAATIVVAANPSRVALVAAIELRDHIMKISGAELPIVPDTAEVKGTRILVGESAATLKLGLKNADFKDQEYMVAVREGNLVLMGHDFMTVAQIDRFEKPGTSSATNSDFSRLTLPGYNDLPRHLDEDCGTLYAVYEFLERDCGVRWYAPTDLGTVYDKQPTLAMRVKDLRRAPAFACRWTNRIGGLQAADFSDLYTVLNLKERDVLAGRFWEMRTKVGGKDISANHGLYSYYDRFWAKNTNNPSAFESAHPEYFAKGYEGIPPQLCLTCPALVSQVAKDACEYFKSGKNPQLMAGYYAVSNAWRGGQNWVSIEPMDNDAYCRCAECVKWYRKGDKPGTRDPLMPAMNGRYSDYVYQFANAVQAEVSKTCPSGHVFVLGYCGHGFPPSFPLDPRVYIGPALDTREWISPCDPKAFDAWVAQALKNPLSEVTGYKGWIEEKKKSGRLLSNWIYLGGPQCWGTTFGFHAFPGYHAHALANQVRMFYNDGVSGLFSCGLGEQLDTYVLLKCLDNPNLDVDTLLDEFFARYYGAAGKYLNKIYRLIEATYCDRSNYPASLTTPQIIQTEEIAWKYLGTEERMAKMAKWMEAARAAKLTDVERQRLDLFDKGPWQYMVEGQRVWLTKSRYSSEVEQLKKSPPPNVGAPNSPDAGGDLAKVDWAKAAKFSVTRTHEGYPAERQIAAEIVHDATHLYLRLSDPVARGKVKTEGGLFTDDRWEIFLAAQCGALEYIQFGIKPDGRITCNAYPDGHEIKSGAQVKCRLDDQGWVTELAVPLQLVPSLPKASANKVYLNLYRPASDSQATLAWSPNFAGEGFNTTVRLGAVTLDK